MDGGPSHCEFKFSFSSGMGEWQGGRPKNKVTQISSPRALESLVLMKGKVVSFHTGSCSNIFTFSRLFARMAGW